MPVINNKLDLVKRVIDNPSDLVKAIEGGAADLVSTVYSNARAIQKATGIASCVRSGNGLWKSFTKHLKDSNDLGFDFSKFPHIDDMFVREVARTDPELFTLCMDQNMFIGYVLTPTDTSRMERARRTLKSDKQPRLALRMSEALQKK